MIRTGVPTQFKKMEADLKVALLTGHPILYVFVLIIILL